MELHKHEVTEVRYTLILTKEELDAVYNLFWCQRYNQTPDVNTVHHQAIFDALAQHFYDGRGKRWS